MVRLARLRLLRQRKALTQEQLAKKAGVNRATIARLEGGTDEPFPTTVRKLADALRVEPDDLMEHFAREPRPGPPRYADESGSHPEATMHLALHVARGRASLDRRIAGGDAPATSRLLHEDPNLPPLLSEAADQLLRFISDARLSLAVLEDSDYGDDEQLFLGVATALEEGEALEALRRFDQEWWVHHVGRARGRLCIDLSDL